MVPAAPRREEMTMLRALMQTAARIRALFRRDDLEVRRLADALEG